MECPPTDSGDWKRGGAARLEYTERVFMFKQQRFFAFERARYASREAVENATFVMHARGVVSTNHRSE